MLNELYTFAEPVQVVPFSNLKWGKFTLLHTFHYELSLSQWGFVNYICNKKHANLVFYVIRYSLDVIIMHSGFTL